MSQLAADSRFQMPAEWEPHRATWIAWPHQKEDWPGKFDAIPWVYAEIVRQLQLSECVCILVNDDRAESRVRRLLSRIELNLDRVTFLRIRTNRSWIRDYGPIFVNGAIIDWHFNGWAKYPDWKHDDAVPRKIGKALGTHVETPHVGEHRVVLEGGSIDVNGEGLLLTTEECLLDPVQARNPGLSRADLESVFARYLGVRKVLWLGRGIAGDDTHGHVDDIARFVGPRTIVAAVEQNCADVNHDPLRENLARLQTMSDLTGRPLEIVELPMPAPVWLDGQRLPASYANFYIANDRVLVPTFNDPNDRLALSILAGVFPKRKVVGIHAIDLVWGLGTLHCLTQQQPTDRFCVSADEFRLVEEAQ